jgi:hypothetical protein
MTNNRNGVENVDEKMHSIVLHWPDQLTRVHIVHMLGGYS